MSSSARLTSLEPGRHSLDLEQALHDVQAGWREAMDNDLNVPKALGRLFAFVRQVNRLLGRGELDGDQARQVLDFMRQINAVLDVMDFPSNEADEPDAQVAKLIEAREKARRAKDFHAADTMRKELELLGVCVADGPQGTVWKKKSPS